MAWAKSPSTPEEIYCAKPNHVVLPTEVVTVLPFGLLHDMGVTDIPSDEDYEDAANVIFSFLDACLLELCPGAEEGEDNQPHCAQRNSSNLVMELTAFCLLRGAVHDVHGTLSFVQPTGLGQMVPTPGGTQPSTGRCVHRGPIDSGLFGLRIASRKSLFHDHIHAKDRKFRAQCLTAASKRLSE